MVNFIREIPLKFFLKKNQLWNLVSKIPFRTDKLETMFSKTLSKCLFWKFLGQLSILSETFLTQTSSPSTLEELSLNVLTKRIHLLIQSFTIIYPWGVIIKPPQDKGSFSSPKLPSILFNSEEHIHSSTREELSLNLTIYSWGVIIKPPQEKVSFPSPKLDHLPFRSYH